MRGLLKSRRVSWASDVNLCQVRLFLSEESPSQVGLGTQDHLQAKASWLLHSNGMGSDDILPPGFEGAQPANQLQIKLSQIPVISWSRPPKFVLDYTWQVVAGDESKEVEIQNQREMRVLEAVYPRPSAIPQNPSVSGDIEGYQHNDWQALLIPLTPIEDEDAGTDTSNSLAPFSVNTGSQAQLLATGIPTLSQSSTPSIIPKLHANEKQIAGMVHGVEPDVVAAASAAFTAVMKSNEHGNMIDQDLLIKILSNPKSLEKFVLDYGTATSSQSIPGTATSSQIIPGTATSSQSIPRTATSSQSIPIPTQPLVASSDPPPVIFSRTESSAPSQAATSSGSFYPLPNGVGVVPPYPHHPPPTIVSVSSQPSIGAPPAKNFNYYKNLIQQHGGERQENFLQHGSYHSHQVGANQEPLNNSKSRDSKPKIMKPCIYFNSSRGCRHGANCAYQHDTSFQLRGSSMQEVQSSKRTKMDREITGT